MKYYFPTTTLNFDGILSSQLISPAGMYRPDTLWWNRFEAILGQRKDSIVLYNRIPVWDIDDPDRDNYPLVVEMDKVLPESAKQEFVLEKSLKAVVVTVPIAFSAFDLEQGKVRFFFRNTNEKNRMLVKASTSVAECKIVSSMRTDVAGAFTVVPKVKTVSLQKASEKLAQLLAEVPDIETLEYPMALIREEREHGAELGYQVGRYAKSLRSGTFIDAFRSPLSYGEWEKGVLPEPFAAILHHFCTRPLLPWNPNRAAIVEFCRDRWGDCFKGKKVAGKDVLEGTPLHVSLQAIARHWASPEESYRISSERNPYMQAFAAFLECGTQAEKYPRFVKEPILAKPEYLLALYGALVGYTSFSRVLLDNRMYLPTPPQKKVTEPISEYRCPREKTTKYQKKRNSMRSTETASCVPVTKNLEEPMTTETGKMSPVKAKGIKAEVQMSLFDGNCTVEKQHVVELVRDKSLLVCDDGLCSAIRKEFMCLGLERVNVLITAVENFCNKYTDGYYGRNPEIYKQTNPDLIDHLLRCFRSDKTPNVNFAWRGEEEENSFISFLETRYHCHRKTHGA